MSIQKTSGTANAVKPLCLPPQIGKFVRIRTPDLATPSPILFRPLCSLPSHISAAKKIGSLFIRISHPTAKKDNRHRKCGADCFLWGGRWDSNPRSSVPQTDALGQLRYTHHIMARLKGLEPLALCLEGRCSIRLSYRRMFHRGAGDGNRTHTTSLEGWGSTTELHPHIGCFLTAWFIIPQPVADVKP